MRSFSLNYVEKPKHSTMSWSITYDWKLVLLVGNHDMREIEVMKKVAVVA